MIFERIRAARRAPTIYSANAPRVNCPFVNKYAIGIIDGSAVVYIAADVYTRYAEIIVRRIFKKHARWIWRGVN